MAKPKPHRETLDAILNEIFMLSHTTSGSPWDFIDGYLQQRTGKHIPVEIVPAVLDLINRVADAVGNDSSKWYGFDADGNKVHIGDAVNTFGEHFPVIVKGFSFDGPNYEQRIVYWNDNGCISDTDLVFCRKVRSGGDDDTEETLEKIVNDTVSAIYVPWIVKSRVKEAIENGINRALALKLKDESTTDEEG